IANLSEKVESIADPEVKQTMLDDLAAISAKLNEQDLFITQIADLRADILSIPEAVNGQGQFDKLYEDLCAQFDKLYEDLSAVNDDSLAKLNEKFDALKEAVDALSSADTQLAVLDGISELRTVYEDNQSLSAVDRAKLLEDVAFVREQVEKKLEEQANADAIQNEDLYAQITELKADFLDNIKALEDRIAAIETADATVKEYYEQTSGDLSGQITALTDSLNEKLLNQSLEEQQRAEDRQNILATLAELKDKTAALSDTVAANELAAAENSAAVSDELARILDQLSPSETAEDAEPVYLYDEVTAITARLDELSAAYEQANENLAVQLADIKEQVHLKELEQNLESVTASEEEQQTLLKEIA
ncbi:MAG: hypothetical protein K2N18_00745, partial [Clostridia bacterium]|nr:hypothetical protein [Clostridia bacterium]